MRKTQSSVKKLLDRHNHLIQSDNRKVLSHVQREEEGWVINTLMVEGCEAPFRYRRQKQYRNLKGKRVNLTYYPDWVSVAGFDMEVMSVVRIRVG